MNSVEKTREIDSVLKAGESLMKKLSVLGLMIRSEERKELFDAILDAEKAVHKLLIELAKEVKL